MTEPVEPWNLLVVDDEQDIHDVTKLALKRKTWRNRPINLTSAFSRREAEEILKGKATNAFFHAALVDVVMETDEAGLELCKFIRQHCPRTLRLIVRTGQPGVAPPDHVLNNYDIDYYLAKPEVTVDRLFSVVRACLRSSQDIATILAFGKQIEQFLKTMKNASSLGDLLMFIDGGIRLLEIKHGVRLLFVHDIAEDPTLLAKTTHGAPAAAPDTRPPMRADRKMAVKAITMAAQRNMKDLEPIDGKEFGLATGSFFFTFGATAGKKFAKGGLYVETREESFPTATREDFINEARALLENWKLAYGTMTTGKWWKEGG